MWIAPTWQVLYMRDIFVTQPTRRFVHGSTLLGSTILGRIPNLLLDDFNTNRLFDLDSPASPRKTNILPQKPFLHTAIQWSLKGWRRNFHRRAVTKDSQTIAQSVNRQRPLSASSDERLSNSDSLDLYTPTRHHTSTTGKPSIWSE